jgi:hypothetical protein
MKKFLLINSIILIISSTAGLYAMDGFFLDFKNGILLKVDVASAFMSKRVIDPNKNIDNSIQTGLGQYGDDNPHGFPRVLEAQVGPYGDLIFNWGYKFPKVFTLGFGLLVSNLVMPSLMFDFKFTLKEDTKIKPYVFASIYSGLFDGFPIGITTGGGIDIYFTDNLYLLVESKIGAEIFVSKYYDDGTNSNPIWHWDSTYAYGIFGIYIGIGYQFKNPYTDKNGKWTGKKNDSIQ